MAINIKNTATEALIRQLAQRTGENQTTAVTVAVQERLARLGAPSAERIMAIGRDIARRMSKEERTMDVDQLLYDEQGLFK